MKRESVIPRLAWWGHVPIILSCLWESKFFGWLVGSVTARTPQPAVTAGPAIPLLVSFEAPAPAVVMKLTGGLALLLAGTLTYLFCLCLVAALRQYLQATAAESERTPSKRTTPVVTYALAAACLCFFALTGGGEADVRSLGFVPADVARGRGLYALVTAHFVHLGFSHLLANVAGLLFLGSAVERLAGSRRYLLLYLVSGLAGFSAQGALSLGGPYAFVPVVGASAGLSGVIGAYSVLRPSDRLLLQLPGRDLHAPVYLLALLWLALQYLSMSFAPVGSQIGHAAHVGGLAFGVCLGLLWRCSLKPIPSVSQS